MNRRRYRASGRLRINEAPRLLVERIKSAPHVQGAQTKRVAWLALRNARTAELRAGQ